jgi:hypothetical protein
MSALKDNRVELWLTWRAFAEAVDALELAYVTGLPDERITVYSNEVDKARERLLAARSNQEVKGI